MIPTHLGGIIGIKTLVLPTDVLRRLLVLHEFLATIHETFGLSGSHRVCAPKASFDFVWQKASLCVISAVIIDFKLALAMKGAC